MGPETWCSVYLSCALIYKVLPASFSYVSRSSKVLQNRPSAMSQYAFSRADDTDIVAEIQVAELGKLSFLSVK